MPGRLAQPSAQLPVHIFIAPLLHISRDRRPAPATQPAWRGGARAQAACQRWSQCWCFSLMSSLHSHTLNIMETAPSSQQVIDHITRRAQTLVTKHKGDALPFSLCCCCCCLVKQDWSWLVTLAANINLNRHTLDVEWFCIVQQKYHKSSSFNPRPLKPIVTLPEHTSHKQLL